jgi:hypothetical protein
MDTYRIYEQFKEPFGEPAARALAETLGAMFEELHNTVTKEDFRILRESIDADVSRLDGSLERLAEAQARTEVRVSELAEAQTRTEARVSELAEAQARTEARVSELAEAQTRTEGNLARLDLTVAKLAEAQIQMATALQRLTIRTDDVVGRTFELQFRDRLTAYLGRFLRRGKLVPNDRLLDQIEPHLSEQEVDDVLRADVIASGLVNGEQTHLVVEVSWTGDIDDIVRADERANLLRRAGIAAIPLVACNAISPESTAFAKMRGVRIWLNGSLVEAAA